MIINRKRKYGIKRRGHLQHGAWYFVQWNSPLNPKTKRR